VVDYDDEEVAGGLNREMEDAEMSALFGGGGIPMTSDEY
jgi:hypothetical protein